jgi:hypothetical protein
LHTTDKWAIYALHGWETGSLSAITRHSHPCPSIAFSACTIRRTANLPMDCSSNVQREPMIRKSSWVIPAITTGKSAQRVLHASSVPHLCWCTALRGSALLCKRDGWRTASLFLLGRATPYTSQRSSIHEFISFTAATLFHPQIDDLCTIAVVNRLRRYLFISLERSRMISISR